MGKRYRAAAAPTPLTGVSVGVPMGKATHVVRVMHRECVTKSTRNRCMLKQHAYAVVEYRGTRPVAVKGASDDVKQAHTIAYQVTSLFDRAGDPANVRELHTCRALTKKAKAVTRQELHVADIERVRTCRVCGSNRKSALCKPRAVTAQERQEATKARETVIVASKRDDTPTDPNLVTRWTLADEKRWS